MKCEQCGESQYFNIYAVLSVSGELPEKVFCSKECLWKWAWVHAPSKLTGLSAAATVVQT